MMKIILEKVWIGFAWIFFTFCCINLLVFGAVGVAKLFSLLVRYIYWIADVASKLFW